MENLRLNKKSVATLIDTHGIIPTLRITQELANYNMDMNIADQILRMMLWQLGHSLNKLDDITPEPLNTIDDILHLQSKDHSIGTIRKQLILGIDNLKDYII